jgi:hypothetical protein
MLDAFCERSSAVHTAKQKIAANYAHIPIVKVFTKMIDFYFTM